MTHTVVCSIRNEGPYIVEWVAWQHMLGFSNVLVLTNDCTDHSPALLDQLAEHGLVTHVRVKIPAGKFPTPTKLAVAKEHRVVRKAAWTFLCDIDEFLVLNGGTTLDALLPPDSPEYIGMAINWRVFGTGGVKRWTDALTHRQFLRSGGAEHPTGRWTKSAFAHADWFKRMGVHAPVKIQHAAATDNWGTGRFRWVSSSGRTLRGFKPGGGVFRSVGRDEIDTSRAQLNHYMMRSAESFALKRGTLSPVSGADRYGKRFVINFDRNDVEDRSALQHQAAFDAVHDRIMALEGVAWLHHLCCADYVGRLAERAGREPASDPRWQHHMSQT